MALAGSVGYGPAPRVAPTSTSIAGALPWGGGSSAAAIANPRDPSSIAAGYQAAYNNALAMNQANYNNILQGYNDTLANQTSMQQAISAGYTDLYNTVLDRVTGVGQARANQINMDSDRNLNKWSQQLIDRGLGNTTIQASVNRGVEADRNQRQLELSDWLAQTQGGFMSSLGQARLANERAGMGSYLDQRNRQLDWMNSLQARYPDAGVYASLAANAAQLEAMEGQSRGYGGGSFGGIPPGPQYGKLGYTGYQEPYYGSSGGGGSSAGTGGGGGYGNVAGGIAAYIQPGQTVGGTAAPAAGFLDYSPGSYGDMWDNFSAQTGVDPYSGSYDMGPQDWGYSAGGDF